MRTPYDLLVVGGGVQGTAIARDAAGRGLTVKLVERGDLACETSGASSKLIHGGLRYLEHGKLALVREALRERELLLGAAPHLVRPLRFVMPHGGSTHAAIAGRPAWKVRLGLFLYDHLGGARSLPGSERVALRGHPLGSGLRPEWTRGFAYSDALTDDARLVVHLARDAAAHGAHIATRTALVAARRVQHLWEVDLRATEGAGAGDAHGKTTPGGSPRITAEGDGLAVTETVTARALVNAAGPWAGQLLGGAIPSARPAPLRLVQGVHVVVPRLHAGDHGLILPQADGRVVFVIPFERDWSLVGTTEVVVGRDPDAAGITAAEIELLMGATGAYLDRRWDADDIAWSTCGIRPLYDDGSGDPSQNTREDVLQLDRCGGAPLLTVIGGKLTTHRRVAERALEKLTPLLPLCAPAWTARARLPGGDVDADRLAAQLRDRWPRLAGGTIDDVVRRHGSGARDILEAAERDAAGGACVYLAPGLLAAEVDHFVAHEWARTVDDVLWRRSKAGLVADEAAVAVIRRRLATAGGPGRGTVGGAVGGAVGGNVGGDGAGVAEDVTTAASRVDPAR